MSRPGPLVVRSRAPRGRPSRPRGRPRTTPPRAETRSSVDRPTSSRPAWSTVMSLVRPRKSGSRRPAGSRRRPGAPRTPCRRRSGPGHRPVAALPAVGTRPKARCSTSTQTPPRRRAVASLPPSMVLPTTGGCRGRPTMGTRRAHGPRAAARPVRAGGSWRAHSLISTTAAAIARTRSSSTVTPRPGPVGTWTNPSAAPSLTHKVAESLQHGRLKLLDHREVGQCGGHLPCCRHSHGGSRPRCAARPGRGAPTPGCDGQRLPHARCASGRAGPHPIARSASQGTNWYRVRSGSPTATGRSRLRTSSRWPRTSSGAIHDSKKAIVRRRSAPAPESWPAAGCTPTYRRQPTRRRHPWPRAVRAPPWRRGPRRSRGMA